MKALELFSLIIAFVLIIWSGYLIWSYANPEIITHTSYNAPASESPIAFPAKQFYPNMRYPEKSISIFIEPSCSNAKQRDIMTAFEILENLTVLRFYESAKNPEIRYLCAPLPENVTGRHFVAGEGGPATIINTSLYNIILDGQVSLYRQEQCERPIIAIHETLHTLGFDHISEKNSVLYPLAHCSQEIDAIIIETINELYEADSLPDLAIESASATRIGSSLSFEITIANLGLKESFNAFVLINSGNKNIREIPLEPVDLGKKRIFSGKYIPVRGKIAPITFTIQTTEKELSAENNEVTLLPFENEQ